MRARGRPGAQRGGWGGDEGAGGAGGAAAARAGPLSAERALSGAARDRHGRVRRRCAGPLLRGQGRGRRLRGAAAVGRRGGHGAVPPDAAVPGAGGGVDAGAARARAGRARGEVAGEPGGPRAVHEADPAERQGRPRRLPAPADAEPQPQGRRAAGRPERAAAAAAARRARVARGLVHRKHAERRAGRHPRPHRRRLHGAEVQARAAAADARDGPAPHQPRLLEGQRAAAHRRPGRAAAEARRGRRGRPAPRRPADPPRRAQRPRHVRRGPPAGQGVGPARPGHARGRDGLHAEGGRRGFPGARDSDGQQASSEQGCLRFWFWFRFRSPK